MARFLYLNDRAIMQDTTGDWFVKELSSFRQGVGVFYWLDSIQDCAVLAAGCAMFVCVCVCIRSLQMSLDNLIIREGFPRSAPFMPASAFYVF